MTNVKDIRDKLKAGDPNRKLMIMSDNVTYIYEASDNIKWDDDNEVLYVLKLNENSHQDPNHMFEIQAIPYEFIQQMEVRLGKNDCMDTIRSCGFDEAACAKFIKDTTTIVL